MNEDELRPMALELHILAGLLAKMSKHDLEHRLNAEGTCVSGLAFAIMGILGRRECTISDIGRQMMISPPTLVPVVDSLERQGLVRRGQDPHDRRRTPLSVTEHGAQMLAKIPMVDRTDALVWSLEAMGPEKAEQLLALLREIVSIMWKAEHPDAADSVVDAVRMSAREQLCRDASRKS